MMTMRWPVLVAVLIAACALATSGRATAAKSCSVTAAAMAFGNYDVYGAAVAVSGSINMTCSGGGNPNPTATLSAGSSGVIANRSMTCSSGACSTNGFSADLLHYNLYTTVAHSTVWGATGVASTPANCNNTTCAWTIFGLIPAAISGGTNDVSVGGYTDAITITVTY